MATVYFTKPVTSDLRADVLAYIRDAINSQARMFDGDTLVSLPTNTVRYNSGNTRFEKWDGGAWGVLNISGNVSPGGSVTTLQFHDTGGVFAGDPELWYDKSNNRLGVGSNVAGSLHTWTSEEGLTLLPGASVGGWARGMPVRKQSDHVMIGGAGWYGANESVSAWRVGFGASWWDATSAVSGLMVDSSGNVAISSGAYPNTLHTNYKGVEIGRAGNGLMIANNDAVAYLTANAYVGSGGNFKYGVTDFASAFELANNTLAFYNAASGSAGADITMVKRFTIDGKGNVAVGPSAPSDWSTSFRALEIGSVGNAIWSASANSNLWITSNLYYNASDLWKYAGTGTGWAFNISSASDILRVMRAVSGTAGNTATMVELLSVSSTGKLTVGTSSAGYANLSPGGTGTVPGYVEFRSADGTRRGYVGWESGSVNLEMIAENGRTFRVVGSRTWTSNGWTSGLEMTAGNTLRWQLSGGYSWGIGNSGANLYFGISTVDDASAAISSYWLYVTGSTSLCTFAGGGTFGGNVTAPICYGTSYLYSYGGVYAQGDVIAYYSDDRLKDRLGRLGGALESVRSLEGFRYQLNKTGRTLMNRDGDRAVHVGVSAQQVEKVLPEAVALAPFDMDQETGLSKSGKDYLTVKYDRLVPLLIEAIKEMAVRIEQLEAR